MTELKLAITEKMIKDWMECEHDVDTSDYLELLANLANGLYPLESFREDVQVFTYLVEGEDD